MIETVVDVKVRLETQDAFQESEEILELKDQLEHLGNGHNFQIEGVWIEQRKDDETGGQYKTTPPTPNLGKRSRSSSQSRQVTS